MYYDSDKLEKEVDRRLIKRRQLTCLFVILFANMFVSLCLYFDFRWWESLDQIAFWIGLAYLFVLGVWGVSICSGTMYVEYFLPWRTLANYSESKRHLQTFYVDEHDAPKDNDIVKLYDPGKNRVKYYELQYGELRDVKYGIPLPAVYLLRIGVDTKSLSPEAYIDYLAYGCDVNERIKGLCSKIEKDGLQWIATYDRLGNCKWYRNTEKDVPKKKLRKFTLKCKIAIFWIFMACAGLMPLVVVGSRFWSSSEDEVIVSESKW